MARNKCISSFRVESGDSRILNKFDERETFVAKLPANLNAENFAIPNGSTERIMFRITLNQETDLALPSTSRTLLLSSIKYLLYVKNSDVWYNKKMCTYYATISSIVRWFSLYRSLYVCWQFDNTANVMLFMLHRVSIQCTCTSTHRAEGNHQKLIKTLCVSSVKHSTRYPKRKHV